MFFSSVNVKGRCSARSVSLIKTLSRTNAFLGVICHHRQKLRLRFRVEDRAFFYRREISQRARAYTRAAGTPSTLPLSISSRRHFAEPVHASSTAGSKPVGHKRA